MNQMDIDEALMIATGVGLSVCCFCMLAHAWKSSKRLKPSRSESSLDSLVVT